MSAERYRSYDDPRLIAARATPPEKLYGPRRLSASCARSATLIAASVFAPGRMTANSSPPSRQEMSPAREDSTSDSQCAKRLVAGRVAAEIVDALEPVEVDDEKAELLA